MKFVVIDTDIYLNCALINEPGHDSQVLSQLEMALKTHEAILLLPEVIELEFLNRQKQALERMRERVNTAKQSIKDINFLSNLSKDRGELPEIKELLRTADEVVETRQQNLAEVSHLLGDMFSSPIVKRLSLTPDIMVRGYKRALARRRPASAASAQSQLDADCMIIETLLGFFEHHYFEHNHSKEKSSAPNILLFCSANKEHFAYSDDNGKGYVIHPDISLDFTKYDVCVIYYSSLVELINQEFTGAIDEEEALKYRQMQEVLAAPSPDPVRIVSTGMLFHYLMGTLDSITQMVLSWLNNQDEPVSKGIYDQTFPNVDADKREKILLDLCKYGLATADGDSYSATTLGREFLRDMTWKARLLGYVPPGGQTGL